MISLRLAVIMLSVPIAAIAQTSTTLSDRDRAAVLGVTQEYRDAWLANDPARVIATLTPDAVLLPSGLSPIQGTTAINAFWFPATPVTRVVGMDLTVRDLQGDGNVAIVRGDGTLTYTLDGGPPVTQRSWFVNVLKKQPDSRWLIAQRAWSDLRR
jgi:uncharacterized protein (TIGR02246 family)